MREGERGREKEGRSEKGGRAVGNTSCTCKQTTVVCKPMVSASIPSMTNNVACALRDRVTLARGMLHYYACVWFSCVLGTVPLLLCFLG